MSRTVRKLADAECNVCLYREFGRLLCETLDRPYLQAPIGLHSTTAFLRTLGEILGLDPEPFIAKEKHTTLKPLWDLWRSVTQDFFATANFAIVANETYVRGVRTFLEDEMGLPCAFAVPRKAGAKTDNGAIADLVAARKPMVLFGSFNERMYMAEAGSRGSFIQLSYPGAIVRRHTGTPVMGYSGTCWLIQEICNALFDMLFHILPRASELDAIEPTSARAPDMSWDAQAQSALEDLINREPVLVRISAAKRLREAAEREARRGNASHVVLEHVERASARPPVPA